MTSVTTTLLSEYLSTSYRPDREYVDGAILERKVGEHDHSSVQAELVIYLGSLRKKLGICVYPEQRVQVGTERFRVADVCVVVGPKPAEQIFTIPPFICFEILSKDDTVQEIQERVEDYLSFGIPYVWILNQRSRKAYRCTPGSMSEVSEGVLKTENPEITIPLAEIFGA